MDRNIVEAELISCIGICMNDWNYENKDILLLNVNNIELVKFLNNFGNLKIYHISEDENSSLSNVNIYHKIDDIGLKKFDFIIDLDNKTTESFNGLLKDYGVVITNLANLNSELESASKSIKNANFKIKMPFIAGDSHCLFLSNKLHPLADICLQKVDMIDDLKYYNAKIHEAVFAMPNYLKTALKDVVKN